MHKKSKNMLINMVIKSKTFSLPGTMVGTDYIRYVTSNLQPYKTCTIPKL